MNTELLNRLSRLTFHGYYDPSKNMVNVHFYNDTEDKPDIIAYLLKDMSWDIREITDEISMLNSDSEVITILHNCLSIEKQGSDFDDFVRLGLISLGKKIHGDDVKLSEVGKMFEILENNEYK